MLLKLFQLAVLGHFRGAGEGRADPVLVAMVACIEEVEVIALGKGRAGVAALVVVERVRAKADSLVLPGDEVRRGCMVPVLEAVHRAPGAPLEEEVPFAFVVGKAVGVAGEAGHRLDVVILAVYGCSDFVVQVPDFIGAFEDAVAFLQGPLSHVGPPFGWGLRPVLANVCSMANG